MTSSSAVSIPNKSVKRSQTRRGNQEKHFSYHVYKDPILDCVLSQFHPVPVTHCTHLFTAIEEFSCRPCRRPNKWFHNACPLHAIFHNLMILTEFRELYKTLYNLLQFFYGLSLCHRKTPGYSLLMYTQSLFFVVGLLSPEL